MGADNFSVHASGKNANDAFRSAVQDAQYEYGHGGYSGTIAEKHSFKMIALPEGKEPYDYADELIDKEDSRIDDKWGPAGCFDLGEGKFMFFGWASS